MANERFPASAFDVYTPELEVPEQRGVADVPAIPPPEYVQQPIAQQQIIAPTPVESPAYTPAPDTYGWAYAPPGHLPGEPSVPIPDRPPGAEIAPNQRVRLPSGVVAYRQTYAEHDRLAQLDQQALAAKRASEQAIMDAQMFAQMSRVAKSVKDIEIAKRSIDMMGLQRDIQNGVPIHDAVARHPMALGTSFGQTLKATAPEQTFSPKEIEVPGGTKLVQVAPNRFQQVRTPPALEAPKSVDVDGTKMVQIAPNRFQQVRQPVEGKLTDQQKARITDLRLQRKGIADQMNTPSWEAKVRAGGPENEKEIAEKNEKIANIDAELAKLQGLPAPAPAARKTVAVIGSGTQADPAKPQTPEEFASIPSGSWFINPKDGKLMRKK